MNDTSPEITEKMCEMFRTKTPQERFRMGCSMYDTSRYLVTRAILRENPHISPAALRQELFLKFYGDDFNPTERQRILDYLAQSDAQR
jgi:hypothetical protein